MSAARAPDLSLAGVAVIGGGPAGLMAAETLAEAGIAVDLFDAMLSTGRKFLLAGKGGLNLTHAEPRAAFLSRYGARQAAMTPLIDAFPPEALRAWARTLGVETFVGSSSRVFPTDMKAAPLLRAWLSRLRRQGVRFHMRHRWTGWREDGALRFATPDGERCAGAGAAILALGGGSWPRLGTDGRWVDVLRAQGIDVAPLQPANCGFDVEWSEHFRTRFAGHPVKRVAIIDPAAGFSAPPAPSGEFTISDQGVEGGLIYAHAAALRENIRRHGRAVLRLDLLPDQTLEHIEKAVAHPRGSRSWSSHLQSRLGLKGVKTALLRECAAAAFDDPQQLAQAVKSLPLVLLRPRPLAEAISSVGGVPFEALDAHLMLRQRPGVFCAGEMLDWEAPTGGYLLSGCFASGRVAGLGALHFLRRPAAFTKQRVDS